MRPLLTLPLLALASCAASTHQPVRPFEAASPHLTPPAPPPSDPVASRNLYDAAYAAQRSGDTLTALRGFQAAAQARPTFADAHVHLAGARTDLQLSTPESPSARPAGRGFDSRTTRPVEWARLDSEQAMRECTEGKHPDAWVARGDAARTGGDLATAEHNYSGAIRLYPHYWIAWTRRGLARFDRGDWKGAAEDFSKRLSLEPAGRARDFAALRLWLCRARLGGRDAASAELRAYRPSGETSEYPDIAAFLLSGRKEFESAAGGPGAAAWFFVGEKRLLDGDREGAIEALRECARLSPRGDAEGESARAELARLGVR